MAKYVRAGQSHSFAHKTAHGIMETEVTGMTAIRPSADEVGDRGQAIYERDIRSHVEPALIGQFVAIDIESGEYEVGTDHYATALALKARRPNAIVFTIKIGYDSAIVMGGRFHRKKAADAL